jgi:hypothetical protein
LLTELRRGNSRALRWVLPRFGYWRGTLSHEFEQSASCDPQVANSPLTFPVLIKPKDGRMVLWRTVETLARENNASVGKCGDFFNHLAVILQPLPFIRSIGLTLAARWFLYLLLN